MSVYVTPLEDRKRILLLRTVAIVLLSFGSLIGSCQNFDSLKSLLPHQKGLPLANTLYQLAYEYVDVDNQLAKKYSAEAFTMAKTLGDSLLLVKSGRIRGLALGRLDEQDSSIVVSLEILPVARRNNYETELKNILNRLGGGYVHKGNYDIALTYHFESLALRERMGDAFEISVALHNIGFVYYALDDLDKALSFFHRCLTYKDKIEDKRDIELLFVNMSQCYAYKDQFDQAQAFMDKAFDACGKNCSTKFLMSAHFGLGLISSGRGDFASAKKEFSKSYMLAQEIDDVRFKMDNISNLLEVARKSNSLRSEPNLLADAEGLLSERIKYPRSAIDLYHGLFQSYGELQNLEKKSFYQTQYIQTKDSIYSSELTTNLMKVEAAYMERENRAKIDAQEKILALSGDIITRQTTLNVITGIVAVLSIGFILLLIVNVKQKKHANTLLEKKVFERTTELENKHNLLLKSLHEREIEVERITNEIRSSLATIKGLGSLVLHDIDQVNTPMYVDKIEETSNNLLQGLNLDRTTRAQA